MNQDKLESIGLSQRFIKSLSEVEKYFFETNYLIIPEVISSVKQEFPWSNESLILISLKNLAHQLEDEDKSDLEKQVERILKREQRNSKIKDLLDESIVFNFSDFNRFF